MFIAMPIAGMLYNRFRTKLIFVGMIITSISFFMLSRLNLTVDFKAIFFPQFLQGIGYGFIFVPLAKLVAFFLWFVLFFQISIINFFGSLPFAIISF